MNQAFFHTKSGYILFLNAGDILFSKSSLEELAFNIRENKSYNIYIGGTLQIDPKKNIPLRLMGNGRLYRFLPFAQFPHPSLVIKREILTKLKDTFDSDLEIAGDYKQQLILRKKNLWKTYFLNQIITIMPIGGKSNKNKRSILLGLKETVLFSFKLYNFLSIFIILEKIILNFYSRYKCILYNFRNKIY